MTGLYRNKNGASLANNSIIYSCNYCVPPSLSSQSIAIWCLGTHDQSSWTVDDSLAARSVNSCILLMCLQWSWSQAASDQINCSKRAGEGINKCIVIDDYYYDEFNFVPSITCAFSFTYSIYRSSDLLMSSPSLTSCLTSSSIKTTSSSLFTAQPPLATVTAKTLISSNLLNTNTNCIIIIHYYF